MGNEGGRLDGCPGLAWKEGNRNHIRALALMGMCANASELAQQEGAKGVHCRQGKLELELGLGSTVQVTGRVENQLTKLALVSKVPLLNPVLVRLYQQVLIHSNHVTWLRMCIDHPYHQKQHSSQVQVH